MATTNPQAETLFTLPIAGTTSSNKEGGKIVCARLVEKVYMLEFMSPPDNRLVTPFCETLLLALDIIQTSFPPGVVITTSSIPKFYSNGLDLTHATFTPGFFPTTLYKLWRRLLTYPMPTIALINGHCFAGALMTAMYHDYRIMNPSRGFACLNEVDLGVPLKSAMSSIFREKCTPQTYRSLVLEGRRFTGPEALASGIVDAVGGLTETLAFVQKFGLLTKAEKGIYGDLKTEMYRESVGYLESYGEDGERQLMLRLKGEKEKKEREGKVREWEGKAKTKL